MNELVVLKRGDKTRKMYLYQVDSGPLKDWIGLRDKASTSLKRYSFIFLEPTQEKLISTVKKCDWEIVEGLGVKNE